ncbi:hypothetical protein PSHT_05181 [Puccinia striiformis]|uniref:P-type ATPase C-terminal domain-containing protein n=1 Tax=Puccinia striiformis TaxID=27350 RepID=A0A2S4WB88_9BASI|nr:hypothetical protein PSHT_05181 [Puccinia striiformis]
MEQVADQFERGLEILVVTALEDKLQVGVPEAVEKLHKTGIKLWISSGDELQTAIEIGYSCSLLKNMMEIMILSSDTEADRNNNDPIDNKSSSTGRRKSQAVFPATQPKDVSQSCETVVCCRVSPAQKASTVKLVGEGRNAMTLAICDGANDAAMIQEAHIGVGIAGLEGAQALTSANYALGQFRF